MAKKELKPLPIVEFEKCLNCRFVLEGIVIGYTVLQCHRYAPKWVDATQSYFPLTYNDNWCGEWEYDEMERYKDV